MTIDEQIEKAYYAKSKQLNSLVLVSNQGKVELLEDEHQQLVEFINELMDKRIKKAFTSKKQIDFEIDEDLNNMQDLSKETDVYTFEDR